MSGWLIRLVQADLAKPGDLILASPPDGQTGPWRVVDASLGVIGDYTIVNLRLVAQGNPGDPLLLMYRERDLIPMLSPHDDPQPSEHTIHLKLSS